LLTGSGELNLTAVLIGDSQPIETHMKYSSTHFPFTIQNVQPSFKFDPNIRPVSVKYCNLIILDKQKSKREHYSYNSITFFSVSR